MNCADGLILHRVVSKRLVAVSAAAAGDDVFERRAVFLPLHASVLEPRLDLSFCEADQLRDLDAPMAGQVAVEVELFLELQRLQASVRRSQPFVVAVRLLLLLLMMMMMKMRRRIVKKMTIIVLIADRLRQFVAT